MRACISPKGTLAHMADLIAALMWGPKTYRELIEETGCDYQTIQGYVQSLRAAGVVYLSGHRPVPTGGSPAMVFSLQPSPFAHDDVPSTQS